MSTQTRTPEMVSDVQYAGDVEQLLESVAADNRSSVRKALEYVRGERDADDVQAADLLEAINHVRRDEGETLVLYYENEDCVTAICRGEYGTVKRKAWSPHFGDTQTHESFREAKDDWRHTPFEILTREDAKRHFQYYIAENRGGA